MSLERILTGCRMSVRVSFSWPMTFAPLTVRELFSILSNGRPPEKVYSKHKILEKGYMRKQHCGSATTIKFDQIP